MPEALRAARQFVLPAAVAMSLAGAASTTPSRAAEFSAGGYTFSDELGGFRLLSASGSGSVDNPIVLKEEFPDAAPATLVIRARDPSQFEGHSGQLEFTLVKQVINRSERVWAGFEFELQEELGKASTYGDGLSFKQFAAKPSDVTSDAFAQNERVFEPYDRIEFSDGHVDPDATVTFKVTITDPTPVKEYYLVQDPKLLPAGLPPRSEFAALPN